MAFSVKDTPSTGIHASGSETVWVVYSSDVIGNYKFKYIARVYVEDNKGNLGGTPKATLRFSPNEIGHGMVDIGTVLNDYCVTQYTGSPGIFYNGQDWPSSHDGVDYVDYVRNVDRRSQHPIHFIDAFSCNDGYLMHYRVEFLVEFSTTPDGQATMSGVEWTTQDHTIFNGQFQDSSYYTSELSKFKNHTDTGLFSNYWAYEQEFNLSGLLGYGKYGTMEFLQQPYYGSEQEGHRQRLPAVDDVTPAYTNDVRTGYMMTDAPRNIWCTMNDFHTLFFMNDWTFNGMMNTTDYSASPRWDMGMPEVQIGQYELSGTSYNAVQWNVIDNGYATGGWEWSGSNGTNDARKNGLFFGCGPANLQNAGISFNANTVLYKILMKKRYNDPAGDASNGAMFLGYQTYYVHIIGRHPKKDLSCIYDPIRLAWLNPFGNWDYYTFTKKSTVEHKTKPTYYTPIRGDWSGKWRDKRPHNQRSKRVYKSETQTSFIVNSDFIDNEYEAKWLEELFNSSEVYIIPQNHSHSTLSVHMGGFQEEPIPVNISDKKFKRKTKENDRLIQYTFKCDIALTQHQIKP